MSLTELAPEWIRIILLLLLAAAAIEDSVRLRISNFTSIGVLLLAFVTVAIVGPQAVLWQNVAVFAATLVFGTFLFGRGVLGGGDVKLLAATVLWFDLGGAFWLLVAVAIVGGLLAMIILAMRLIGWSEKVRKRVVVLRPGGGIPYGIAIAAGAAAVIVLWQATGDSSAPAGLPPLPVTAS